VKPLLKSALWYLENWRMNPLFNNVFKRPLHDEWTSFYMAELKPADVINEYNKIVSKGKKPAGVALIPSKNSRVVVLDIDKSTGVNLETVARRLADKFVVAITPRGGLRIAFKAKENSFFPSRIVIKSFGERIGEGGGSFKHPWTFPPSVACVKEEELPDGRRKCLEVKHYYFVLPDGRLAEYPWEIPFKEPPEWDWNDAKDLIGLELGAELEAPETVFSGDLKVGSSSGFTFIPVPCWRTLNDFIEWLETDGQPHLPNCVARALGYKVREDGTMEYTGEKVPHGLRYTLGATATMFLTACIAQANPEEIINFVGQNIEDFPADEGEPLNTKLSRLLVRVGNIVVPKYTGVGGALSVNIPPELCKRCVYGTRCMQRADVGQYGLPENEASIKRPWMAYVISFYNHKIEEYRRRTGSIYRSYY